MIIIYSSGEHLASYFTIFYPQTLPRVHWPQSSLLEIITEGEAQVGEGGGGTHGGLGLGKQTRGGEVCN